MTAEQYDPARASKIGLIVFDMAGTTVNDEDSVNRCLREALGAHGLEVTPEQVNAVMGIFKPDAIRILIGQSSKADSPADRVDAIHEDFVARSVRFYREDPSVHEVEGAGRTFARLQGAGITVALNTGFNLAITDVILDRLGWRRSPLVDATITSDEVARGRPHPDMIRALMAKFGIEDPSNVALLHGVADPVRGVRGKSDVVGIGIEVGAGSDEAANSFLSQIFIREAAVLIDSGEGADKSEIGQNETLGGQSIPPANSGGQCPLLGGGEQASRLGLRAVFLAGGGSLGRRFDGGEAHGGHSEFG